MAGRNDVAIDAALEAVAQAMQNQPNAGGIDESRSLIQNVRYGTHMLDGEADNWWIGTRQRLETVGEVITWVVFTREFLRKYFPKDVQGKKEMEFHTLKQGNSFVTEYAAEFVELVKFYPHYSEETSEFLKCIKFESGLRTEIKRTIGYQQIRRFAESVNNDDPLVEFFSYSPFNKFINLRFSLYFNSIF
ncbi:uncharacterized protein LOC131614661 [Vicia villosa]|uniref:uncharacterized protein LOC131614661 n=1 Tax=Vicia villosa TaxID=3911 RepID=UPI00273BEA7C|nr:uncharacterized protein LOC131614661 [Vicia villosa]